MGMGLRDVQVPSAKIKTPGGEFSVRGFAFEDIAVLARTHGPAMSMVFGKLMSGGQLSPEDMKTALSAIAPQVPELVAAAIALAADDYTPEAIAIAGKLNFHHQVEALEAIFKNTFQSEAEVKKFMETVIRMLLGATSVLQQMRLPLSELGFGDSGDK